MQNSRIDTVPYVQRLQLSATVILLIFIFLVKWYPVNISKTNSFNVSVSDPGLPIELVEITFQASMPPPPSRPRVPVMVPEITPDEIPLDLDMAFNLDEFLYGPLPLPGSSGLTGEIRERPQRPPRVIRIVEAVTPEAVLQQNLRIEIIARFTVDITGRVEEVEIMEIKLRETPGGVLRPVQTVGFGVIEAVFSAGRQWQFRPASQDGTPVRAYSMHIFTFGRD